MVDLKPKKWVLENLHSCYVQTDSWNNYIRFNLPTLAMLLKCCSLVKLTVMTEAYLEHCKTSVIVFLQWQKSSVIYVSQSPQKASE